MIGNEANNALEGGAGNDSISGREGNDVLVGSATITGPNGDYIFSADDGDDTIFGDAGDDFISGCRGNDSLVGGSRDDSLFGDEGDDILIGNAGLDYLNGEGGSDNYFSDNSQDFPCDSGEYSEDVNTVISLVTYDLMLGDVSNGIENFTLIGDKNINAFSRLLDNVITDNDSKNNIVGAHGADALTGEGGADIFRFCHGKSDFLEIGKQFWYSDLSLSGFDRSQISRLAMTRSKQESGRF